MKILYKSVMADQIAPLPVFDRIHLTYVLYPKTRRLCDISNVCSVHSKFFEDALVEMGKLSDDNYKFLPEVVYRFGSVDKDNPRVDIRITPI